MQTIDLTGKEKDIIIILESIIKFMNENNIKDDDIKIDNYSIKDYLKKMKCMEI